MTAVALIRRKRADRDISLAAEHDYAEGGEALELRFIDALETALMHIAAQPSTGSQRWGELLQRPGLRTWPIKGFPYLIFYLEHATAADVIRVLHGRRDLPRLLQEQDELGR